MAADDVRVGFERWLVLRQSNLLVVEKQIPNKALHELLYELYYNAYLTGRRDAEACKPQEGL
ncbi:MAG: hypothetical protein ACREBG_07520 [Pyrinomonadaceae bacterium]